MVSVLSMFKYFIYYTVVRKQISINYYNYQKNSNYKQNSPREPIHTFIEIHSKESPIFLNHHKKIR